MELREPKKKRVGSHIKAKQPFPILIESENETSVGNDMWPLFVGNFSVDCVTVCNPEEMISLYTMGCFGKGSFSRGYPSFGVTKKGIPPLITERQWKRRKLWIEKIEKGELTAQNTQDQTSENSQDKSDSSKPCLQTETDDSQSSNQPEQAASSKPEEIQMEVDINEQTSTVGNENRPTSSESQCNNMETDIGLIDLLKQSINKFSETADADVNSQVLVITDSDDEDLEKVIRNPKPHLENEPVKTVVEVLNLTLEEAFFLSYALGCLHVIDMTGNVMSIKLMWTTFCQVKPDFIESYVTYHHFRAKGWVVKPGHKFGGDFLLYKQGPAFYHATYIVLVERVNNKLQKENNSLTWTKLHGLNRLGESSGKDIITCQVLVPDSLTPDDLLTPKCLRKCQVHELLTKRWISSQEREDS